MCIRDRLKPDWYKPNPAYGFINKERGFVVGNEAPGALD
jgi:hypothetical protein